MTSIPFQSQRLIPPRSIQHSFQPLRIASVPLVIVLALWAFSPNSIGLLAITCAFVLTLMPWWSYTVWRQGDLRRFPLFSIVSSMYVIAYVLPLFLGSNLGKTSFGPRVLAPDAIDNTMLLAVIGVLALGVGIALRLPDGFATQWKLEFSDKALTWNYVRLVFMGASALAFTLGIGALGQGGRQAMVDLESVVVIAAFLALYRRFLRGQSERLDQILLAGYVVLCIGKGVASGWLGAAVWFVIEIGVCYFDVRRRVPKLVMVIVVVAILFLQPGKDALRGRYWHGIGNSVGTSSERAKYWVDASVSAWSQAVERPEERSKLFGQTLSRVSLFEPTAMVMQMTPTQVPYQNGRLYKYFFVTLIPRAIWPNKPSFSGANQFYQVAYGITDRRDLGKVSMAVGSLAESYINFGWFGPPLVMFVIGLVLNVVRRYFLDADQGEFLRSLGIALLPSLMIIESQAVQYLAGIIQAVVLTVVIFLPALQVARAGVKRFPAVQPARGII
jgi:hypothetical protein